MRDTVTLHMSEQGRWSAVLAYTRWPGLPRHVFEACAEEAKHVEYKRFPKSLRLPTDESSFLAHCEKVFAALMTKVVTPEGTSPVGLVPGQAHLVAYSLIANACALVLSYEAPAQLLDIPDDCDEEALLDTLGAHCLNCFGPPRGITHTVVGILRTLFMGYGLTEGAAQETAFAASICIGGLTPNLVREIVETGAVPELANSPFKVTAKQVQDMYHEMEKCVGQGINVDALAAELATHSASGDLVEGLRGLWCTALALTIPYLWPPDKSTAGALSDTARRDTWGGDAVTAAKRAKWRFDKRQQRERKRFPVELDKPVETGEGQVSLSELIPDESATVEPEESLESVMDAYRLTQRERQVAWGKMQDYQVKEIATLLGVSPRRVRQLRDQIEAKLKPGEQPKE